MLASVESRDETKLVLWNVEKFGFLHKCQMSYFRHTAAMVKAYFFRESALQNMFVPSLVHMWELVKCRSSVLRRKINPKDIKEKDCNTGVTEFE